MTNVSQPARYVFEKGQTRASETFLRAINDTVMVCRLVMNAIVAENEWFSAQYYAGLPLRIECGGTHVATNLFLDNAAVIEGTKILKFESGIINLELGTGHSQRIIELILPDDFTSGATIYLYHRSYCTQSYG